MATYYDVDQWGNKDSNGKIKEYYDDEALSASITLWLNSKKGDYLLQPNFGGILDPYLFRTLTPEGASAIGNTIQIGFETQFVPKVTIESIDINIDYDLMRYEISIEYINPTTNRRNSVTVYSKQIAEVVQLSYDCVGYTEQNLVYFMLNVKPDNKGEKLTYNADEGKYYYGQYKLVNLTSNDPYFETIKNIANS